MEEPDGSVPPSLRWLRAEPGGARWLEELPSLVRRCTERWGLVLAKSFEGNVSYVAPGRTSSGVEVVLKINFPHRESLSEPSALRHWDGNGAVGLLDEQEDMRALLLERCIPGEKLWDIPDLAATSEVIGVFERLWDRPAPDDLFEPLSSAAVSWAEHFEAILAVPRGPGERALVEGALMFLSTEPSGDRADVVLHQDLHGGNVLKRGSEWIAIDPKPLAGEREFDTASFIRDRRDELTSDPDAGSTVRRRIDILSEHLGLDRARVKGWALVHALAWGSDPAGELYPEHALAARLIAQA